MTEYKKISFRKFKKLGDEKEQREQNKYELKGIPRGVTCHRSHKNEYAKDYQYRMQFYLQKKKDLIRVYTTSRDDRFSVKEGLLKVASEGNLEITVKGIYESAGKPFFPALYMEEFIINDHNFLRTLF